MEKFILKEYIENVLVLKLNRPEALNSLNTDLLSQLGEAVDEAANDDNVNVIIITGQGKAFVAGADIAQMSVLNASEGKEFGKFGASIFRKLEEMPKAVIAAVNGFALGGGCELAMACDIRIASEKAKFGQPEVGLGITPGFSGTQRMSRLVGPGKAKELIFTGNIINAQVAKEIGLVNHITEPEKLMETALEMAKKISSNAQLAVAYAKEAIERGSQTDISTAIEIEASLFGLCFSTEDQKEGMAAFLEKRKPVFIKK
ncbi:enoyl-CoA hydratase-related protein [Proteocatella sphenisci]|uniref:enoyl-CoA hydratase-related protein n=1 Tax=Proteocatella sphenisci TaxID=181070 RepID=UPI00048F1A4D|nr:enoyl-CoA hydratase-related protein [Proteocatella sphenisci]